MTLVLTTNIGGGMQTYYSKKFLRRAANTLRMAQWGQMKDLPKGEGKTIQFFRYNAIALASGFHMLTEGTNPDETSITGQNLSATLQEWGAFSKHSSLVKDTHIDRNLAGLAELWGDHAGRLLDLLTQMEVAANGAFPIRSDGNNSYADAYSYAGTMEAGATSTTFKNLAGNRAYADYGNGADDANQSVIVITTGVAAGQARACYDYDQSTGVGDVAPAWDVTPALGDGYTIVSAHGLTSDPITTTIIAAAIERLQLNGATPFADGFYVGLLSPTTVKGLKADTTWADAMKYSAKADGALAGHFTGKIADWGGVHWYWTNLPFRFPVEAVGTAGTAGGVGRNDPANTEYTNYSPSGDVFASFVFGQEAFGVTRFKGMAKKPGIIVKNPGPQDTSNPLNMYSTIGWYMPFVCKALNPLFAVQIWSDM